MTASKKTTVTYKRTGYEFVQTNGVEKRYFGRHLVAYAFELFNVCMNEGTKKQFLLDNMNTMTRALTPEFKAGLSEDIPFSLVVKRDPKLYRGLLEAWFGGEFSGPSEGKEKLLKEILAGLENNLDSEANVVSAATRRFEELN